ncbi:MAG TPA: dTDP-4-dehydrorhamnose reductase [Bacteroidales bacterium]|nr:dTDP-4-dehydrorhamnose reductase [Bacteroidales bacterium]HRZ48675.1 dTDP-4-dehydrorhamnose reductase [Bacteroidales bacterium]
MARILITGSRGQLGRAILDLAHLHPSHTFTGVDIGDLDLCDEKGVALLLKAEKPDVVVNCAAYTAVDLAEDEPEKAWAINAEAVKTIASLSAETGFLLIHVSTDYVFSGLVPVPYHEEASTSPLSVYGQSKLEGEIAILYGCPAAYIIRTSWLYYPGGKNFVNTIIRHATQRKELKVVYDQTGSPTHAGDLAAAILTMINHPRKPDGVELYHYANHGVLSWYDFAKAITEEAGLETTIVPVLTASLNQKAIRPAYSVLNTAKIREVFGVEIPYWRDSLRKYLQPVKS